jgi:hypothetical protein
VFCGIAQLGVLYLVIETDIFLVIYGFLEQVAMPDFVLLIVGMGTVAKLLFVLHCSAL